MVLFWPTSLSLANRIILGRYKVVSNENDPILQYAIFLSSLDLQLCEV